MPSFKSRVRNVVKEALPGVWKTSIWLVKITVSISIVILLLRYSGIFYWLSNLLSPLFSVVGLPGEAALAYIAGYFVNVYSAIAVMTTLSLDVRSITILSVMVLCSHSIIVETTIQKKTGSSAVRMVVIRTCTAVVLGVLLHGLMPAGEAVQGASVQAECRESFQVLFTAWFWTTLEVVVKMIVLIFSLSLLQRILAEFGVIRWIVKFLKPVMRFFGLPPKTAFLWIVANTLGLAYGAAVMLEESERGKISKEDANFLNHHICVSHSNLEDVVLLVSVGGLVWWLLFPRWIVSFILVWELRLERWVRAKRTSKKEQKFA